MHAYGQVDPDPLAPYRRGGDPGGERTSDGAVVNAFTFQRALCACDLEETRPEFVMSEVRPPQYSDAFVDWIVGSTNGIRVSLREQRRIPGNASRRRSAVARLDFVPIACSGTISSVKTSVRREHMAGSPSTSRFLSDTSRAREFYGKLFGWQWDTMEGPGEYHMTGSARNGRRRLPGKPVRLPSLLRRRRHQRRRRPGQELGGKATILSPCRQWAGCTGTDTEGNRSGSGRPTRARRCW